MWAESWKLITANVANHCGYQSKKIYLKILEVRLKNQHLNWHQKFKTCTCPLYTSLKILSFQGLCG
jgi:hypothetical protein